MTMRLAAPLCAILRQDVYQVTGRWAETGRPGLEYVIETLAGWRAIEMYPRPGREDGVRVLPLDGRFVPDEPLPPLRP